MTALSNTLKHTEIKRINKIERTCTVCNGTGEQEVGLVDTKKKGALMLINDCHRCKGQGKIIVPVPIRVKKTKSKVEVF